MDIASWISFFEENKIGLKLELEGMKVLEVRPKGKNLDIEIHDIAGLKKLKEELKKWRG